MLDTKNPRDYLFNEKTVGYTSLWLPNDISESSQKSHATYQNKKQTNIKRKNFKARIKGLVDSFVNRYNTRTQVQFSGEGQSKHLFGQYVQSKNNFQMKGNLKIFFKERTIYFYIVSPTTVKAYLHLLVKRINKQSNQNTDFKLKLKSKQHI